MKYMMPYTLPIAERGEGIRDEERADGVLLLRRGLLDEVYDALYASCPSLD